MNKVCPGRFRNRGMFLFELYVVSQFLLNRDERFRLTRDQHLERLQVLRRLLGESVEILSWEPPQSVEGQRCQIARGYLQSLEETIKKSPRTV